MLGARLHNSNSYNSPPTQQSVEEISRMLMAGERIPYVL
jgi:hypothetical protein